MPQVVFNLIIRPQGSLHECISFTFLIMAITFVNRQYSHQCQLPINKTNFPLLIVLKVVYMDNWTHAAGQNLKKQHCKSYCNSGYLPFINHHPLVVGDTQSDSIPYLNFAKKWFIQYLIQYCFTQDSIQNIIQFKINSGNSIQKIIQFNSQGMIKGRHQLKKNVFFRALPEIS